MNKNDFKRSKYLILVMVIVSFSIFYLVTTVYNLKLISINANNYLTKSTSEFSLKVSDTISTEEVALLKKAIKDTRVTEIRSDEGFTFYYFNEDSKYRPILKCVIGDSINAVDSSKGENNAVVENGVFLGEGLYEVFVNSGKDNYFIEGKDGRVIEARVLGVIESGRFDFKEYTYYLTLNFDEDIKYYSGIYKVDGAGGLERFKDLERQGIVAFTMLDFSYFDTSGDEFNSMKLNFNIGLLVLFFVILIFVSYLWVLSYVDEMKARRICGANRFVLSCNLVLRYLFMVVLGFVFGFLLYRLFSVFV